VDDFTFSLFSSLDKKKKKKKKKQKIKGGARSVVRVVA
jgi:hypothetical protein